MTLYPVTSHDQTTVNSPSTYALLTYHKTLRTVVHNKTLQVLLARARFHLPTLLPLLRLILVVAVLLMLLLVVVVVVLPLLLLLLLLMVVLVGGVMPESVVYAQKG